MMVTPFSTTVSPGLAELAVAALLGGEIDDDRAGPHAVHHLGGDQHRRAPAGNQRGGDAQRRTWRCGCLSTSACFCFYSSVISFA